MKYQPWTNGYASGLKCTGDNGKVTYIYLNPSSEDSEGVPNVFVYGGVYGDPALDQAMFYIDLS